jgi:hypothetical protein
MWEWQADMELDSNQNSHNTENNNTLHPDDLDNTF